MRADYVIVGAGSAGCALAYRLSEAGRSAIVIEAGGSDAGPFIQMPGALSYPMNMRRYDWGFRSEPEPHLDGRRMAIPRGKVIGGSSSINGMVWVRGHPLDFDHWAEAGAQGWAARDVLPYYRRLETWDHGGKGGDAAWRGVDGPVRIQRGKRQNPLFDAFVQAGVEAGYGRTDDYNGYRQEGFGPADQTIHRGRRWSAATAYLWPALRRFNCRLVAGHAERVVFEGRRATGVLLASGDIVTARREVILAASALKSPQLLMLSGIGPAEHLKSNGVEVVADRPGVGQNLQDHLEISIQVAASRPVTLHRYWNPLGKAYVGLRWLLTRTGPGASNQIESLGFVRSAPGIRYPDIQFHFFPIAVRYDGQAAAAGHGFQAHVGPMRSASRGTVALRGPEASSAPRVRFNYMSQPTDWQEFRAGIRLLREIFAQPALALYTKGEIQPGPATRSDDEIDAFIRAHSESAYHPCGTCRMGAPDDPLAVVDPETRVIGVEGLRVADSSIFPRITNGNINAPSILVGEKAADHILGRAPLDADDRGFWEHPAWTTEQR